jgi:hypothetical protein
MICEQLAGRLVEGTRDFRWTTVFLVDVKDALQVEVKMKLWGQGPPCICLHAESSIALTPM